MSENLFFYELQTEQDLWQQACQDLSLIVQETLREHPACRLALSGGSTPQKLYECLAELDLPWDRVKLVILDERYVPSDHPESNLGMIRRALLRKIPLPPENLLFFDTSMSRESAAADMERKLKVLENARSPLFDALILGAGMDGHIASLFEETFYEGHGLSYAEPSFASAYPVQERLSLGLGALLNSKRALLLLKGKEKRVIQEALMGERSEPPLTALRKLLEKMPVKVLAYWG